VAGRVHRGGGKTGLLPHALRLQAALNPPATMHGAEGRVQETCVILCLTFILTFLFSCANSFCRFSVAFDR
jgi:hypothetical protein